MKKGFLIIGVVVAVLLAGGVGIFLNFRSQEDSSDQEVLSVATSVPSAEVSAGKLPKLEVFSDQIEIKLSDNQGFKKAVNGQEVPVGSQIKTDAKGRGQVVYPNNSVTRIDFNSQMTVEEFSNSPSKTKIKIDKGRIWNRVAKLLGKEDSFESETETLVASVRGTSYGHGIQADGNNKVSVSRSQVHIDCNDQKITDVDVTANKKVTTKCSNSLQTINWSGEESKDEWFNWNLDQDKQLDQKYGIETYNDAPSPTPKPTVKPTLKPSASPTASPISTTTPNNTPTPLTISGVTVECSSYGNSCNSRTTLTQLKISGSGYSASANPTVYVVSNNPKASSGSSAQIQASEVIVSTDGSMTITAKFNSALYGSYKVILHQYDQTAEGSVNIQYLQ